MNVLCVVAHPDDEVLGCGGTLRKHFENGDGISYITLSPRKMHEQIYAAHDVLGIDSDNFGDLPDQKFETVQFTKIVDLVTWNQPPPDLIYTHWPHDLNLDHALTAKAVLTAFRAPHSQATILAFETLSSTEFGPEAFTPNHWETLTKAQLDRKIAALDCYPSEVKDRPHPRNAEGVMVQARWRGQQVCQPYAEAFQVLRSIR